MLYGVANKGCRENFLKALAPHGLGWRDIVPNVNWFMTVPVSAAGDAAIALGSSRPGDHVDIRAEMDVLVVLSNTPHRMDPRAEYAPRPVELVVLAGDPGATWPFCGLLCPNMSASRTPVQGAGFTGGMKRFLPVVDSP